EFLQKEGYMKDYDAIIKQAAIDLKIADLFKQEGWQVGRQEGWQEGSRSILEFLRNGHTLEEAEKKFAVSHADNGRKTLNSY
ncbi:MAG: hypothetical protein FWB85_04215, partial [Chitinispirillia bacterium]|nr:hypothetical protein [Chitinispirillia bacterium]MCL2241548.1 hypothetical protein [Chitinispirillia bacterium]